MADLDDVQHSLLSQEEEIELQFGNNGSGVTDRTTSHDGNSVRFTYSSFGQGMDNLTRKVAPGLKEHVTDARTRENGNTADTRENGDAAETRENEDIVRRVRSDDTLEARATIKRLEFKRSRNYRRSLQFIDDTPDSQMDDDSGTFSPQTVGKLVSGSIHRSAESRRSYREDSKEDEKEVSVLRLLVHPFHPVIIPYVRLQAAVSNSLVDQTTNHIWSGTGTLVDIDPRNHLQVRFHFPVQKAWPSPACRPQQSHDSQVLIYCPNVFVLGGDRTWDL
nr:uncharacterized protein LOC123751999 [Procambarus clarkii]